MFAFHLALKCGFPHPDFLLARMSARQFVEALAYHNVNTVEDERADERAALLACVAAQTAGNKNASPTDFMPHSDRRVALRPTPAPTDLKAKLRRWLHPAK